MPTDHPIAFFVHDSPRLPDDWEFEYSANGYTWEPIRADGVAYYPNCFSGTVYADDGYLRARGLVINPSEAHSEWSDIQVLPEPTNGLFVGVIGLLLAFKGMRGHKKDLKK